MALRGLVAVTARLHAAESRDTVLDAVVDGVRRTLGYGVAVIRVLDDDGATLRTVAVSGPPDAVAAMTGTTLPMAELSAELELADRSGEVYFVPHERLPPDVISSWVPAIGAATESRDDAWHPMDTLCVALKDTAGAMLGVLGVDLPADGRRPDARRVELLGMFAGQAALAIHRTRLLEQKQTLLETVLERDRQGAELVAALIHDLKGPLTAIRGRAELARESLGAGTSTLEHLVGIERATERMAATIDELLVRRIRDAAPGVVEHPARWVRLDLVASVRELVADSLAVAQHRSLTLELSAPPGRVTMTGDERQIRRAVDNLISNALKYTPAGGRILVSVEASPAEIVVSCTDTGIGVPVDEQQAIFDDHVRSRDARAAGIEGTGVGLPTARRIIEAHGGTLTLTSSPGQGSTFSAHLPRRSADPAASLTSPLRGRHPEASRDGVAQRSRASTRPLS